MKRQYGGMGQFEMAGMRNLIRGPATGLEQRRKGDLGGGFQIMEDKGGKLVGFCHASWLVRFQRLEFGAARRER